MAPPEEASPEYVADSLSRGLRRALAQFMKTRRVRISDRRTLASLHLVERRNGTWEPTELGTRVWHCLYGMPAPVRAMLDAGTRKSA